MIAIIIGAVAGGKVGLLFYPLFRCPGGRRPLHTNPPLPPPFLSVLGRAASRPL